MSEQIIADYAYEVQQLLDRMAMDGVYLTGSNFSLPQRFIVEGRLNPPTEPRGIWKRRNVTLCSSGWLVGSP